MCSDEFDFITVTTEATISEIYEYRNSIFGILDTISTDYSNLKLDATEIYEQLADPTNMTLLKDVVTKLG